MLKVFTMLSLFIFAFWAFKEALKSHDDDDDNPYFS